MGNYCPEGSDAVVACPAGTYMDELGAESEGPGDFPNCKPCKAGTYNGNTAQSSCTEASAGNYSQEGATA